MTLTNILIIFILLLIFFILGVIIINKILEFSYLRNTIRKTVRSIEIDALINHDITMEEFMIAVDMEASVFNDDLIKIVLKRNNTYEIFFIKILEYNPITLARYFIKCYNFGVVSMTYSIKLNNVIDNIIYNEINRYYNIQ